MNLLEQRAAELIERLRKSYSANRFQFECSVTQTVQGKKIAVVRQEIIRQVTQEKRPLTRCSTSAVTDCLKAHFEQMTLF